MSTEFKFEVVDETIMQQARAYSEEYRPLYEQIINLKDGQALKISFPEKKLLRRVYGAVNGTFGKKNLVKNQFWCRQRVIPAGVEFTLFIQKLREAA
jgi:pyridoxine/pyridoxamine 5'-phosphate oxidase